MLLLLLEEFQMLKCFEFSVGTSTTSYAFRRRFRVWIGCPVNVMVHGCVVYVWSLGYLLEGAFGAVAASVGDSGSRESQPGLFCIVANIYTLCSFRFTRGT